VNGGGVDGGHGGEGGGGEVGGGDGDGGGHGGSNAPSMFISLNVAVTFSTPVGKRWRAPC
jgi:hypothetical protein